LVSSKYAHFGGIKQQLIFGENLFQRPEKCVDYEQVNNVIPHYYVIRVEIGNDIFKKKTLITKKIRKEYGITATLVFFGVFF
jgi:hypothetical protein